MNVAFSNSMTVFMIFTTSDLAIAVLRMRLFARECSRKVRFSFVQLRKVLALARALLCTSPFSGEGELITAWSHQLRQLDDDWAYPQQTLITIVLFHTVCVIMMAGSDLPLCTLPICIPTSCVSDEISCIDHR